MDYYGHQPSVERWRSRHECAAPSTMVQLPRPDLRHQPRPVARLARLDMLQRAFYSEHAQAEHRPLDAFARCEPVALLEQRALDTGFGTRRDCILRRERQLVLVAALDVAEAHTREPWEHCAGAAGYRVPDQDVARERREQCLARQLAHQLLVLELVRPDYEPVEERWKPPELLVQAVPPVACSPDAEVARR